MRKEQFKVSVHEKRRKDGWLFFGPSYYVTLKTENSSFFERQVGINQYHQFKVGEVLLLTMYSKDDKMWYFTEEEARLAG